jgi:hypothetical protein
MKKGRIHSSFFKRNNITPEEAYLIVNNMVEKPKCSICGNHAKFKSFISVGYLNDVDPEIIGNIENLQMLPWKENITKGKNCHITLEQLNEKIQRSKY